MSYILDALRKAEAERSRGATTDAPGAAAFHAGPGDRQTRWRGNRWLWILTAAATGAVAAAFWLQKGTAVPSAASPVPAMPSASAVPTVPSAPAAPIPVAPVPPVAMHFPPPSSDQPASSVAPLSHTVSPRNGSGAITEKTSNDDASLASLATLRELPEEIQRQIPPLTISGYIYAANPADRSVLINRKLLREGEEVAPGLTLEKLMPKGMVLNYKGYRYRGGY